MGEVQTIRQAVMGDGAVANLCIGLHGMPGRIQEARDNWTHAEFELSVFNEHELAKDKVDELELEAIFEVAQEVEENGKKKHVNEQQRKAATVIALSHSQEYLDAKNKLIQTKRVKAELEMKVGKLRNQFYFAIDDFKAQMAVAGLIQGLCHEHENSQLMQYLRGQSQKIASMINRLKEGMSDV